MSRNYDTVFKRDAVQLYHKSGRDMTAIAQELGIPKSTFTKWVRTFEADGLKSFPGKGHPRDEELQKLRKELAHVTLERDILKKAVAIFSHPEKKGSSS